MAQSKGHTGNPHGRPKGTPNKITCDVRSWLANLINENRSKIIEDLASLEPKDRLIMIEKLLPYVVPKIQSVEQEIRVDNLSELNDTQLEQIVNKVVKECMQDE